MANCHKHLRVNDYFHFNTSTTVSDDVELLLVFGVFKRNRGNDFTVCQIQFGENKKILFCRGQSSGPILVDFGQVITFELLFASGNSKPPVVLHQWIPRTFILSFMFTNELGREIAYVGTRDVRGSDIFS